MSTTTTSRNGQVHHRPASHSKPGAGPHGHARLELEINGSRYNVRPTSLKAGDLPYDPIAEVKSFRFRKSDGTLYIVSLTLEGCGCTCPDFVKVRSRAGTHCKHIKAAFAVGLLSNVDADTATARTVPPLSVGDSGQPASLADVVEHEALAQVTLLR